MSRKRKVEVVALTLTAQRPTNMNPQEWAQFRSEVANLFACAGWSNVATERHMTTAEVGSNPPIR